MRPQTVAGAVQREVRHRRPRWIFDAGVPRLPNRPGSRTLDTRTASTVPDVRPCGVGHGDTGGVRFRPRRDENKVPIGHRWWVRGGGEVTGRGETSTRRRGARPNVRERYGCAPAATTTGVRSPRIGTNPRVTTRPVRPTHCGRRDRPRRSPRTRNSRKLRGEEQQEAHGLPPISPWRREGGVAPYVARRTTSGAVTVGVVYAVPAGIPATPAVTVADIAAWFVFVVCGVV
jgi:hypothetical protein